LKALPGFDAKKLCQRRSRIPQNRRLKNPQ
jgi:hypothetical protein